MIDVRKVEKVKFFQDEIKTIYFCRYFVQFAKIEDFWVLNSNLDENLNKMVDV